jgi:PhnB protein
VLMASDALEGFGPPVQYGTHVSVSLHTDSRDQADALYASLAEGGQATFPLQDAFWGGYFGQVTDQFGVQWMLHYDGKGA